MGAAWQNSRGLEEQTAAQESATPNMTGLVSKNIFTTNQNNIEKMQFYDCTEADHFFIQSKYFFRYMLKKNSYFIYILPSIFI